MLIYNYDLFTREYIGESFAELDPEETKIQKKDVHLIPANATAIKPPKKKKDTCILWTGDNWLIVDDYRENYYKVDYDLNVYDITTIGDQDGFIVVPKELGEQIKSNSKNYVIDGDSIREKTEEEKQAEDDAEFNKQFFNTSLGYVRRSVTMKDGSKKDFLTDILPMLVVGVPVLVYSRELEQTRIQVTEPFINECKQQLFKDFYGEE